MKRKSVLKKKKKKDDKNEQNIEPTKHERVGNINFFSEEVVKEIINKLISNTIISIENKKMNKIIDEYYIYNLFNSLNNIIEIYNINHDADLLKSELNSKNKSYIIEIKEKTEKNIYTHNNNKNNNNNKDEIKIKTHDDDIDIKQLNNITLQYNAKISLKNFWDSIPQPESFSFERTSTYQNVTIRGKNPDLRSFTKRITNNRQKSQRTSKNKKYGSFIAKKMEDNYMKKKKTFIKPNDDLPSEKISDSLLGTVIETEEIKNLRKKLMEEINKKRMEEMAEIAKKKLEDMERKNEKNKNKDKKDKKQNQNGIDQNLFQKEFISISSNQKEIQPGVPLSDFEIEQKKQKLNANKHIEYNFVQHVKREKDLLKEKELVKKNFIKKYRLKSQNHMESDEEEKEEPTGDLTPSGSNFGLIKPEVGVIIQESAKIKSGGINFFEKYNKFSVNDFNKTMNSIFDKSYTNNLNTNLILNSTSVQMNADNKNIFNLNNTTTGFNKQQRTKNENSKKNGFNNGNMKVINEKKLFRNTFMNKLSNLKKKFLYKSRSEIVMSNNYNNKALIEALSSGKNEKSYYYYSNNLFDSNKKKDEFNKTFEINYIGKTKDINKKFFSPIPTNVINMYKNTLLKNYFNNNEFNDNIKKNNENNDIINNDKNEYKIMDTFNKVLLDRNDKYNEIFYKKIINSDRNGYLPKIQNKEFSNTFIHNRTNNYFFKTRKKKSFE